QHAEESNADDGNSNPTCGNKVIKLKKQKTITIDRLLGDLDSPLRSSVSVPALKKYVRLRKMTVLLVLLTSNVSKVTITFGPMAQKRVLNAKPVSKSQTGF